MSQTLEVRTEYFRSDNERCEATLYLPAGDKRPPVLVMGHGFAGERQFGLPAFAQRFARAGYAVLLFDYRGIGGSGGEPRRLISVARQLQDWRAAIAHARTLEQVDSQRLMLWGTSFGGGHVLSLAAEMGASLQAVIAHVPHVDGRASSGAALQLMPVLRLLVSAVADGLAGRLGLAPVEVPVVGAPGSTAILNTEECEPGYRALVPDGADWANKTPARVLFDIVRYRPCQQAEQIRCPTLVVAASRDSLIPLAAVRQVAASIPNATLLELDSNHFEPYVGPAFEHNVTEQLQFLSQVAPVA